MLISGYEIVSKLAEGGMAAVYLAVQESSGEEVALKVLSPELTADDAIAQRFLEEGRLVAGFDHPNIIKLRDVGESNGHCYLAMEFMAGGNLKTRMQRGMTEDEVIEVISQIGSALVYAHQQGVLHLDVTPHNILFDVNGTAVLTDFGIAKQYSEDEQDTTHKLVLGNPRYMSPEQIKGEKTGPASDIYSLGVVMYEMLSGQVPFQSDTAVKTARMHLFQPPPKLPEHYSRYQAILDCLLEKIPDRRFSSVQSFLSALHAFNARQAVSSEDKTIVLPVQKAIAAGGILSLSGMHDHTMELDSEEIQENTEGSENISFPDRTDPMSVEEVLGEEQPVKSHQSIEQALKRFEDYSFRHEEEPESATDFTTAVTDGGDGKSVVKKKNQSTTSSPPLIAVRDDLKDQEDTQSWFSDLLYFLSCQRETIAKLAAVVAFVLVAGYLYQTISPKYETGAQQETRQEANDSGKLVTEKVVEEKPVKEVTTEEEAIVKNTVEDESVVPQETEPAPPLETAKPAPEETGEGSALVLHEDSGLVLSNGRYIINTDLEQALKNIVRNVVRVPDGSLKIFLDQVLLYHPDSMDLNPEALKTLARLAYIFRNRKDFRVEVTDRTMRVDTPEDFYASLNNAKHIVDYFINQGLSSGRVRGKANTRHYEGSFSGVELSLIPSFQPVDKTRRGKPNG